VECRVGCGACCIAPSIRSPIPGMPNGKPAGVRCIQLDEENLCRLFGDPARPAFCAGFRPSTDVCGASTGEALQLLFQIEAATQPAI
jgi:uncharacterized protein